MNPANNHSFFADFINSLTEDLDSNLTIKEAKPELIANFAKIYEESKNTKKALIFSVCVKEQKEWSKNFSAFGLKTYVAEKLGGVTLEGLKTVEYQLILINVDSIFNQVDKMFSYIRSEDSKNKDSLVFLVTHNEEHLSILEKRHFDENTTLLSERRKLEKKEELGNASA